MTHHYINTPSSNPLSLIASAKKICTLYKRLTTLVLLFFLGTPLGYGVLQNGDALYWSQPLNTVEELQKLQEHLSQQSPANNRPNRIRQLVLASLEIDDRGATALANILEGANAGQFVPLITLDLTNNQIGEPGVLALANAIRHNQFLETLHLANNPITAPGIEELLFAVADTNFTLRNLDIIDNLVETRAEHINTLMQNRRGKDLILATIFRLRLNTLMKDFHGALERLLKSMDQTTNHKSEYSKLRSRLSYLVGNHYSELRYLLHMGNNEWQQIKALMEEGLEQIDPSINELYEKLFTQEHLFREYLRLYQMQRTLHLYQTQLDNQTPSGLHPNPNEETPDDLDRTLDRNAATMAPALATTRLTPLVDVAPELAPSPAPLVESPTPELLVTPAPAPIGSLTVRPRNHRQTIHPPLRTTPQRLTPPPAVAAPEPIDPSEMRRILRDMEEERRARRAPEEAQAPRQPSTRGWCELLLPSTLWGYIRNVLAPHHEENPAAPARGWHQGASS